MEEHTRKFIERNEAKNDSAADQNWMALEEKYNEIVIAACTADEALTSKQKSLYRACTLTVMQEIVRRQLRRKLDEETY